LERPLSVLVENFNGDRAFLFSMLTSDERRFFERLEARGYLRVDHGGGLSTMQTQIAVRRRDPWTRHRLWVLFDSDALRPNQPSAQSEALRLECGDVPHYQLARRHIESYLPAAALSAWAFGSPRAGGAARAARLRAYLRLRGVQRHHFNMKEGFSGDAARMDATAGDLYDGVPDADKVVLSTGFGRDIAELFRSGHVTEPDLKRDSGWTELRPIVQRLIAFLR
jgi:hypothetical protein